MQVEQTTSIVNRGDTTPSAIRDLFTLRSKNMNVKGISMVSRVPTIAWLSAILLPIAGWIVLIKVTPVRMHALWAFHFADASRERLFVASLAFFVSFGALRGITYSIHHGAGPFRNIVIRNVHIHHLVWGVLLLLCVGYLWLAQVGLGVGESSRRASTLTALLYGAAAALTLDEFALWLNLEDVYWTRKGRQSVDDAILFGSLLLIGVHGWSFLGALAREARLVGR